MTRPSIIIVYFSLSKYNEIFNFYKSYLEIELISTNKVDAILRMLFHMDLLGKKDNGWWPKEKLDCKNVLAIKRNVK